MTSESNSVGTGATGDARPAASDGTRAVSGASDPVRQSVDLGALAGLLQARGFRAECITDQDGRSLLRSATGGIAFHLRPGNSDGGEGYLDFSYLAALQLAAPPPDAAIGAWNAGKRFARLHARDRWVILEMDVLVAGGVTGGHLAATLEVWDRLLHDLVVHLRSALASA